MVLAMTLTPHAKVTWYNEERVALEIILPIKYT